MSPSPKRLRNGVLAALLLATALAYALIAWNIQGIYFPDEIFQSLEQAHRFAFGYGMIPWEFRDGARSWVFPGALGLLLKGLAALGVHSGPGLVRGAKLAMAGMGVASVWGAFALAEALAGLEAAALAGALTASFPLLVLLSGRTLSETACAPFIVWGALFLDGPRRRPGLAGALIGVATLLRFQCGLLAAAFGVLLLVTRRFRDAGRFAAAGLGVLVLGGLLDWVTWGSPFHALIAYLSFNLIHGRASHFGVAPPTFYFVTLWRSTGLLLLFVCAGWALATRRTAGLLAVVGLFAAVHVAIPHKELRFLAPVLPLALALSAVGLARPIERFGRGHGQALALGAAVLLAIVLGRRAASLTFGDVGQFERDRRSTWSAWHLGDGLDQVLWAAGARPDLCGVALGGVIWFGGFSYLHRDVPMLWGTGPRELASANYVVAPLEQRLDPAYVRVGAVRDFGLYRREGPCARYAGYSRNMPGP